MHTHFYTPSYCTCTPTYYTPSYLLHTPSYYKPSYYTPMISIPICKCQVSNNGAVMMFHLIAHQVRDLV